MLEQARRMRLFWVPASCPLSTTQRIVYSQVATCDFPTNAYRIAQWVGLDYETVMTAVKTMSTESLEDGTSNPLRCIISHVETGKKRPHLVAIQRNDWVNILPRLRDLQPDKAWGNHCQFYYYYLKSPASPFSWATNLVWSYMLARFKNETGGYTKRFFERCRVVANFLALDVSTVAQSL